MQVLALANNPVVWVIEGTATQPLRDMLRGLDPPDERINGAQGPKRPIALSEGEGVVEAAVANYGLPPKKEDT